MKNSMTKRRPENVKIPSSGVIYVMIASQRSKPSCCVINLRPAKHEVTIAVRMFLKLRDTSRRSNSPGIGVVKMPLFHNSKKIRATQCMISQLGACSPSECSVMQLDDRYTSRHASGSRSRAMISCLTPCGTAVRSGCSAYAQAVCSRSRIRSSSPCSI